MKERDGEEEREGEEGREKEREEINILLEILDSGKLVLCATFFSILNITWDTRELYFHFLGFCSIFGISCLLLMHQPPYMLDHPNRSKLAYFGPELFRHLLKVIDIEVRS